jgi:hypothetical protein
MNDRLDRHFDAIDRHLDAIERRLDWCILLAGVNLGLTLANFGLLLTLHR